MNGTIASSEQVVKLLFTGDTLPTRPTEWWVALHSGDPTNDGSANEITDNNYVRQSADFTADQPSGAEPFRVRNDADLVFPTADASYTVAYVSVYTSQFGGEALAVLELALARDIPVGGVFSIPAQELVITGA